MSITWLTDAGGLTEPSEVHGSAKESWSEDKITCDVQLRCPWANRYAVLSNILGYGLHWPYHTDPGVYAISGGINNDGAKNTADGSGLSYQDAILDVHFETANRNDDPDSEITVYDESIEPTAEFLTIDPGFFYWDTGGFGTVLKQSEAPGRLQLGMDYVVTLYNLASIPVAVQTLAGKCNNAPVVSPSLGMTFDTETLLFSPPKITRKIAIGADSFFTMQVRYTHRPTGWNKFWFAKTSTYERIKIIGGSSDYYNYPTASFAGMVP